MRRLIASWAALSFALLPGCGYLDPGQDARVLESPDLSRPLPKLGMRVGLYAAPSVRDSAGKVGAFPVDVGRKAVPIAEALFRRVFADVKTIPAFPPPEGGAPEEVDVAILVERPELECTALSGSEVRLRLRVHFAVCSVGGTRVDELDEEASARLVLNSVYTTVNEAKAREGLELVARACIHQFLLRTPGFMNKRY